MVAPTPIGPSKHATEKSAKLESFGLTLAAEGALIHITDSREENRLSTK